MDAPIHTLFKLIESDKRKYISYDTNERYYDMLRTIMKDEKFNGKNPISILYENVADWKKILTNEKYLILDIILFEMKMSNIRIVNFPTDTSNIQNLINSYNNQNDNNTSSVNNTNTQKNQQTLYFTRSMFSYLLFFGIILMSLDVFAEYAYDEDNKIRSMIHNVNITYIYVFVNILVYITKYAIIIAHYMYQIYKKFIMFVATAAVTV